MLWDKGGEPSANTVRAWRADITEFLVWLLLYVDGSMKPSALTAPGSTCTAGSLRPVPSRGPKSSLRNIVPLRAFGAFLDVLEGKSSAFLEAAGGGGGTELPAVSSFASMLRCFRREHIAGNEPADSDGSGDQATVDDGPCHENILKEHSLNRRITTITKLANMTIRQGWAELQVTHPLLPIGLLPIVRSWKEPPGDATLTVQEVEQLIASPGTKSLRDLRDSALLMVLLETAFHRWELCALNVSDFNHSDPTVRHNGKGRTLSKRQEEAEGSKGDTKGFHAAACGWLSVPSLTRSIAAAVDNAIANTSKNAKIPERRIQLSAQCTAAIGKYLEAMGMRADPMGDVRSDVSERSDVVPLFRNLDHRPEHSDGRLSTDGIYALVTERGRQIGVAVTPRSLRRTALARASN